MQPASGSCSIGCSVLSACLQRWHGNCRLWDSMMWLRHAPEEATTAMWMLSMTTQSVLQVQGGPYLQSEPCSLWHRMWVTLAESSSMYMCACMLSMTVSVCAACRSATSTLCRQQCCLTTESICRST